MITPRILLVEDDAQDAEWVRRVFAKLNLARCLFHVSDGPSALRAVHEGADGTRLEPSLILLDLALPGMDGLSVLQHLKADEATRATPVFVLTGSSEDKLLLESYRLGASAFLVKPLTLEKITAALNEAGYFWTLAHRQTEQPSHADKPRDHATTG